MSSNLCLSLTSNYLSAIDVTDNEIITNYLRLNQTLINHIHIHITIKNDQYLKFIILYGCETIAHIFKLLLQYTRSLGLAVHHTEKSILFYVEFITQIGDENHSFLQLNSKDAVIFLYKKTIFDIDESYLKTFEDTDKDKDTLFKLHHMIQFYLTLIGHSLNHYTTMDALIKSNTIIDKNIIQYYQKIITQIETVTALTSLISPYFNTTTELIKYIITLTKKKGTLNILQIMNEFKQSH